MSIFTNEINFVQNIDFLQTKLHSPSALEQRTQTLGNQIDRRKQKSKGHGYIIASVHLIYCCSMVLDSQTLEICQIFLPVEQESICKMWQDFDKKTN